MAASPRGQHLCPLRRDGLAALAPRLHSRQDARAMRPLSSLLKRHLVRQLVDEEARQGRLNHFGPIASTGGLLDLLCDFIRQMKRLEIWPDSLPRPANNGGLPRRTASCWPSIGPTSSGSWITTYMMPRVVSGRPAICSTGSRSVTS